MNIARGFAITIASGLAFGLAGAGVGYLLGTFLPDYYRMVFRLPPGTSFDPAQAGLGLGITQGLTTGLIVGLVIVVTVAWYNSQDRARQRALRSDDNE